MIPTYVPLLLKFLSLGFIACAGGFWSGAVMETRPKYRDEQTLVSGTIWSQVIIPIGLLMTETIGETFHDFIHAYFYVLSIIILFGASLTLIVQELRNYLNRRDSDTENTEVPTLPSLTDLASVERELSVILRTPYDRTYIIIGGLFLCAAITTTINLIVIKV